MMCDCGHKAERGILTAYGIWCLECRVARVCPSQRDPDRYMDWRDNATKELRQAKKCLRKKLPLEWSESRLDALARRLVRNQHFKGGRYGLRSDV